MSDRIVGDARWQNRAGRHAARDLRRAENLFVASFIGEINIFDATVIERLTNSACAPALEGRECNITVKFSPSKAGQRSTFCCARKICARR